MPVKQIPEDNMRTHPEAIGTHGVRCKRSCRELCYPEEEKKKKEEDDDDDGEILGGTGYGRWGRVLLFTKSTPSNDTDITQNCSPF